MNRMEYYSALKRKEVLTHATLWMKLENIMLSKISQLQKDNYCVIPLYEVCRVVTFIEIENGMVGARAGGKGERNLLFNGY